MLVCGVWLTGDRYGHVDGRHGGLVRQPDPVLLHGHDVPAQGGMACDTSPVGACLSQEGYGGMSPSRGIRGHVSLATRWLLNVAWGIHGVSLMWGILMQDPPAATAATSCGAS